MGLAWHLRSKCFNLKRGIGGERDCLAAEGKGRLCADLSAFVLRMTPMRLTRMNETRAIQRRQENSSLNKLVFIPAIHVIH